MGASDKVRHYCAARSVHPYFCFILSGTSCNCLKTNAKIKGLCLFSDVLLLPQADAQTRVMIEKKKIYTSTVLGGHYKVKISRNIHDVINLKTS
jgi:hypothetical protein